MTEKLKVIEYLLQLIFEEANESDKENYRHLLDLVEADNLVEAYKYFSHLDTYLRETAPEDVVHYLWLNRTGLGKTKTINLTLRTKSDNIILYKGEMKFPDDATDLEIGRNLMNAEDQLLKDLLEFEYD